MIYENNILTLVFITEHSAQQQQKWEKYNIKQINVIQLSFDTNFYEPVEFSKVWKEQNTTVSFGWNDLIMRLIYESELQTVL